MKTWPPLEENKVNSFRNCSISIKCAWISFILDLTIIYIKILKYSSIVRQIFSFEISRPFQNSKIACSTRALHSSRTYSFLSGDCSVTNDLKQLMQSSYGIFWRRSLAWSYSVTLRANAAGLTKSKLISSLLQLIELNDSFLS